MEKHKLEEEVVALTELLGWSTRLILPMLRLKEHFFCFLKEKTYRFYRLFYPYKDKIEEKVLINPDPVVSPREMFTILDFKKDDKSGATFEIKEEKDASIDAGNKIVDNFLKRDGIREGMPFGAKDRTYRKLTTPPFSLCIYSERYLLEMFRRMAIYIREVSEKERIRGGERLIVELEAELTAYLLAKKIGIFGIVRVESLLSFSRLLKEVGEGPSYLLTLLDNAALLYDIILGTSADSISEQECIVL